MFFFFFIISSKLDTTPSPLSGSQDLLSLFHLKPLYDTYVRPYPPPGSIVPPPIQQPIIETTTITTTGETKIKSLNGGLSIGFTMGGIKLGGGGIINADGTGIGIGEKEKSEKEKGKRTKIEKSYAHLVEDIPGVYYTWDSTTMSVLTVYILV